ncbi:ZZ-type zinc finger-containing protein 3 [Eumeta japonica]|uniref:ZZ-type zinc finger-containing protein 3 n=1 Tax=Eumeta variegata TaxID=151549 RepID=A0A4C1YV16_EUMVA|nr:ZZ-type zinc finger-containing protein 3 [Eumeta japonica]
MDELEMRNSEVVDNNEGENEFLFETDHLALRSNKEYCDLLKYIITLEAQRTRSLQDIEELAEAKNKALENPIQFVENLQAGNIKFPCRQTIAEPPSIDWNSFGIDIHEFMENKDSKTVSETEGTKVRGRIFTESKPETFNQLWSCQEQKRLEELLEIYPEEPIIANRYKKIAQALGTRTPVQVMSRVQKYFAKLAKAGLPIPGRAPKRMLREKVRSNILYKKSTFFPQLYVPVKMEDSFNTNDIQEPTSSTEQKSGKNAMIELLKMAREQRILDEKHPVWQTQTMCVGCHKVGFPGARWTDNAGTDYCTDCFVRLLPTEKLIPIRTPIE